MATRISEKKDKLPRVLAGQLLELRPTEPVNQLDPTRSFFDDLAMAVVAQVKRETKDEVDPMEIMSSDAAWLYGDYLALRANLHR